MNSLISHIYIYIYIYICFFIFISYISHIYIYIVVYFSYLFHWGPWAQRAGPGPEIQEHIGIYRKILEYKWIYKEIQEYVGISLYIYIGTFELLQLLFHLSVVVRSYSNYYAVLKYSRNVQEYEGIRRNMQEYFGIYKNIQEYAGI